jgi:hypothetical protein
MKKKHAWATAIRKQGTCHRRGDKTHGTCGVPVGVKSVGR